MYFKRRACSQRLREANHHWLLRNSGTTVNKVRGIEKEIFAHYWRQKYPNGTNGKSLSWMGLTRERWCCTRGLVSRLDTNTCQTSIKTDIFL